MFRNFSIKIQLNEVRHAIQFQINNTIFIFVSELQGLLRTVTELRKLFPATAAHVLMLFMFQAV